jgi:hypothetical protein
LWKKLRADELAAGKHTLLPHKDIFASVKKFKKKLGCKRSFFRSGACNSQGRKTILAVK